MQSGRLSTKKAADLLRMKGEKGYLARGDIESVLGATMSTAYAEDSVSKLSLADIQQSIMRQLIKLVNPSGKMKEDDLLANLKLNANAMRIDFGGEGNAGVETVYRSLTAKPEIKSGKKKSADLYAQTQGSDAAWSQENKLAREDLLLNAGKNFAKTTLIAEDAIRTFAEKGIKGSTVALDAMIGSLNKASSAIDSAGGGVS